MAAYTDHLNQTMTYWAPTSPDQFGQSGYAAPVAIACRWQSKRELVRDANGNQVISSAVVYPAQALTVDGWAAKGDQTGTADPHALTDAYKIISSGDSPSVDATLELNKVWL